MSDRHIVPLSCVTASPDDPIIIATPPPKDAGVTADLDDTSSSSSNDSDEEDSDEDEDNDEDARIRRQEKRAGKTRELLSSKFGLVQEKKVKTITYDQITDNLIEKFGSLKDWSTNLKNNLRTWPCSPARRVRLLRTCHHLCEFVAAARPQDVGRILDRKGYLDRFTEFLECRAQKYRIIEGEHVYMSAATLATLRWDVVFLGKWSVSPDLTRNEVALLLKKKTFSMLSHCVEEYKLKTQVKSRLLLGTHEIRMLNENLLSMTEDIDTAESESVSYDIICQQLVLYLTYHYTMSRPGALLSTKAYPNTYLTWRDVEISRRFAPLDEPSAINPEKCYPKLLGWDVRITLRHLKGYQTLSCLILRYNVRSVQNEYNLPFDAGVMFLAHAFRSGIIEDDIDTFLMSDKVAVVFKPEALSQPVFRARFSRSALQVDRPLTYDDSQKALKAACYSTGLIPDKTQIVSSYGMRAWSATKAAAYFMGYDRTRKALGHKKNSAALEDVYDQAQNAIDFAGAMMGEKALDVELDRHPYQQAPGRAAAHNFKLRDAIAVDTECINLGKYLMQICLTTGSSMWKLLPSYQNCSSIDPAYEFAVLSSKLKARSLVVQRANSQGLGEDVTIALELSHAFVEKRAAKFAQGSKMVEILDARLRRADEALGKDLTAARTAREAHHVPTSIDLDLPEPAAGEEPMGDDDEDDEDMEDVEEEIGNEEDEVARMEEENDAMDVDEGHVIAQGSTTASTDPQAPSAYIDGRRDQIAIAINASLPPDLEKFQAICGAKVRLLRTLVALEDDLIAKKKCHLCQADETVPETEKENTYTSKEMYRHQVDRDYHTPALRMERFLDISPVPGWMTALKENDNQDPKACPYCIVNGTPDKKSYHVREYKRITILYPHLVNKHFDAIPKKHQLFLREKVLKHYPTWSERKEAGWTSDRRVKPSAGWAPRGDTIGRITADVMARAKDDPAGEHILLQGEVAGDHSWKRPSMLTAAGRLPGTGDRSDNHLEWPHDDEGAWEEDHAWGDASIWAQDD